MDINNEKQRHGFITRRVLFSAGHRLHSPHLPDAENALIYGKCNHSNGHGHNYVVEVTLFGPIDKRTGMVENLTNLKEYMNKAIMDPMDHKNLDKDVEFFKYTPSTSENVAVFIWENMKKCMPQPELLYEVKLHETENNIVVYRGD